MGSFVSCVCLTTAYQLSVTRFLCLLSFVIYLKTLGTTVALGCRDWERQRETSVRTADLRAVIWIRDLQNTKQK